MDTDKCQVLLQVIDLREQRRAEAVRERMSVIEADARHGGIRVLLDGVFNHVGRDFAPVAQALAEGGHRRREDGPAGITTGRSGRQR